MFYLKYIYIYSTQNYSVGDQHDWISNILLNKNTILLWFDKTTVWFNNRHIWTKLITIHWNDTYNLIISNPFYYLIIRCILDTK